MAKDTLIQTNVQVSVRESQLLSEETVDRLIQANSYEEAIQVMLDSSYARYFRDNQKRRRFQISLLVLEWIC